MNDLTKKFLEEYDDNNNLGFDTLQYRKGARVTGKFGLSEGYRVVDGKITWGDVRIHSGVDRSFHGTNDINTVIAPFNFDSSWFKFYGDDHVYGTVLRLFNKEYGFEMRIIHMKESEFSSQFRYLLANGFKIPRNTVIGKAGNEGRFNGKHTHTELISFEKSCLVFDDILELKYREDAFIPYTKEHVLNFYRKQPYWKNERRDSLIITDYKQQVNKRKIEGGLVNDFSYYFHDWFSQKLCTRYSSSQLFNGL